MTFQSHLTINNLLPTGSLSSNINGRLTHFIIMCVILYSYNKEAREKKMLFQMVTDLQKIFQYTFWKKLSYKWIGAV